MVYMRDYHQDDSDSLHSVTTNNHTPNTLLYPTPTNTHDIPRDNDSEADHRTTTHNALHNILAIARASYLLIYQITMNTYHITTSSILLLIYIILGVIDLYDISLIQLIYSLR